MRFIRSWLVAIGLASSLVAPRHPGDAPAQAPAPSNASGAPVARTAQLVTSSDVPNGLPGRWTPVPDSPCGDLVAADPAAALGPLAFVDCPSKGEGCKALGPEQRVRLPPGGEVVRLVRGTPMMAYVRLREAAGTAPSMAVHVVEPLGGAPVFAVAGPVGRLACTFAPHVGAWGFALSPVPYAGQRGPMLLAWAPFEEPTRLTMTPILVASWPGAPVWADSADVPTLAIASRMLFVQTELGLNGPLRGRDWGSAVRVFDPSTGKLAASSSVTARSPVAVSDGAVALVHREGRAVLALIGATGTVTVLRRPPARYEVTRLAVDRSGEHDGLVWIEQADQSAWLYSASLVGGAASNVVRVGMIDPGAPLVANGGEVLSLDADGRARIVRLATGHSSWTSPTPPERFRRPLWIDDEEIWLEGDRGIVRLAR